MIIDKPESTAPLRQLWKEAFGDPDVFLDSFFAFGFSPDRCRQVTIDGTVAAALYWFDCTFRGKKLAYLYAIATHKDYRNRGLCKSLMADTHHHLKALGYDGAILVPAKDSLFPFYEKLGYRTCCKVREFTCAASGTVDIRFIEAEKYMAIRQKYLPAGSVAPSENMFRFLTEQYFFYEGKDFALCATAEGDTLIATELLGNLSAAPGIVAMMGKKEGRFRTPGSEKPFAMYYPLTYHSNRPTYFPFALD